MTHTDQHSRDLIRDSFYLDAGLWKRGRNVLVFLALIAWIGCAAGALENRQQFEFSYLTAFVYFVSIGIGALFFVMIQYLTGSAWSVPVRRLMENISVTLPAGIVLFVPLAFGLSDLYAWVHPTAGVVAAKSGYLNPTFFLIRAGIFLAIWSLWALQIYKQSTRQDRTNAIGQMRIASAWSAPGLLLLTLTTTLASFDWVMSLNAKWYSTIFGLYVYSGGAFAFMAVLTLICLGFRRIGVLKNTINEEHYHDLGKWMFALTCFWAYMAFSQYLLIWYANIPEETVFYHARMVGTWREWSLVLLFGHFAVPFLMLISRPAKRNRTVLTVAASWIALMHFVDLHWLIMPNLHKEGVSLSWMDPAALLAVGSVVALVFWGRLRHNAIVPVGDLRFEQGLAFKNA